MVAGLGAVRVIEINNCNSSHMPSTVLSTEHIVTHFILTNNPSE